MQIQPENNLSQTVSNANENQVEPDSLFHLLVDSVKDYAIYALDVNGYVATWNSGAENLKGYRADEIIGKHFSLFYSALDIAEGKPEHALKTALVKGKSEEDGWRIRKDGSLFWANGVIAPLVDASGRLQGYSKVTQDLTESRKVVQVLREHELRLQEAQHVARLGFWEYDLATEKFSWSSEMFRIHDLDPRHGEPDYDANLALYTPEDATALDASIRFALTEGRAYELDVRSNQAGKNLRWYQARGKPILDDSGNVVRLVGTLQDITIRKLIEDTAARANERLHVATEVAKFGIWEYDLSNNVLSWDKRMLLLYDLTPETFSGTYESWTRRLHPADREQFQIDLENAIETGANYDVEYRIVLPGEIIRFIKTIGVLLQEKNGMPKRMIGLSYDITEAKGIQRVIQEQSEELERSNSDLRQFAYVASHDLQEPLRMVTSYLQLIEKKYSGQLDEQAVRWIDYAVDGAARMQILINDLLAFSRVESHGKNFQMCELNLVISTVLTNLQVVLEESQAEVTCDDLPRVWGDQIQLVSLFQNLLENAIKYRSEQPPDIQVTARQEDQIWLFSVQDNGIGIDPQFADRIFTIFSRLHSRTKYPGTGIGLALCRRIVERHGGRIWVESEAGEGATFFFTLQAKQKER